MESFPSDRPDAEKIRAYSESIIASFPEITDEILHDKVSMIISNTIADIRNAARL